MIRQTHTDTLYTLLAQRAETHSAVGCFDLETQLHGLFCETAHPAFLRRTFPAREGYVCPEILYALDILCDEQGLLRREDEYYIMPRILIAADRAAPRIAPLERHYLALLGRSIIVTKRIHLGP